MSETYLVYQYCSEVVLKKLLASGMSADEILEKLK